ncbi:MAG: hypothetical protein IPL53_18495 [Ignavibacteria bacterium]|nr:hypothetical protein [Ignavibacteria bacterium]
MKRLISALSVFVFVFAVCLSAYAQPANTYTYSTTTGATLEDMTGATVLQSAPNDDTPSLLTTFPGGFVFYYEGIGYSQFSTSPDGFLKLGAPVAVSQFSNSVTSTTNVPKLFPMWDDLALGSLAGGGNISYKLVGTTPNQKLVIQWFCTIPRATGGAANSTFQVWLNESSCGSGVIDFVYGAGGNAPSSSVGINGVPAGTNFQSITVSTNTNSTVTANNANAVWPGSGRQYTYTPPPAANSISVTGTNLLNGRIFSTGKCYDFTATVTKSGPSVESNVPVVFSIDGVDAGTLNTGTLGCNNTQIMAFTNALCNLSEGPHTIAIRTESPNITNGAPLSVVINVGQKITTLPYVQNFFSADGMTILVTNPVGTTGIWSIFSGVNPDGLAANPLEKPISLQVAEVELKF